MTECYECYKSSGMASSLLHTFHGGRIAQFIEMISIHVMKTKLLFLTSTVQGHLVFLKHHLISKTVKSYDLKMTC